MGYAAVGEADVKQMIWLSGVLAFVVGLALFARGSSMFSAELKEGTVSFRAWALEFWLANPRFPAMGLANNGRWALHLVGGIVAMVTGWRLVRIAGRID